MKSIVFFNNKGGVGKTTLACNVVSYLTMHRSKRVLLVDADPQCNATQALLEDDVTEDIYLESAASSKTLYSYLKPIEIGEPQIDANIRPTIGTGNRFQTDLLPGHPRMSIIEDRLSDAWSKLQSADIGGFRVTNWCSQLLSAVEDRYDLVVFDVGPSLGALNRTVILASDYIVTPLGCDIFSLLGIRNISDWIKNWTRQYERAVVAAKEDTPGVFDEFALIDDVKDHFRFAGYSVQQYVTRRFKEGPRPVKSYEAIMREIPETVASSMQFLTAPSLFPSDLELGHIPYVYSLVPMAQSAKAPIHSLQSSDGVVGSQYNQVKEYAKLMSSLCDRLLNNVRVA